MSWSRRWTGCADGGSAPPGDWSAPSLPCDEWACHFLCSCKESNQRNTPPSASRRCAPRFAEGRRGTRCAQTPAPLRPRRTCGARLATRRTRQPQRRPTPARSLCRVERRSTRARSAGFAFSFFHRAAGWHARKNDGARAGAACRGPDQSAAWMRRPSLHGWIHGVPCKPAPPVTSRYRGTYQPRGGGSARWPQTPHHLNSTRLIASVPMPATSPYTVSWPLA